MPVPRKRKCRNCHEFFRPDPRNAKRQKYCSKPECRKASKAASQKKWLGKPENRDYFRGPQHVQRVREWRKAHPGYWRKVSPGKEPLQDRSPSAQLEKQGDTRRLPDNALQDLLSAQDVVLLGLLAHLIGSALQDDIVMVGRKMQQLGQDIFSHSCTGGHHDNQQTPPYPPPGPPGSRAVQLDRSPPGP